MFQTPTWWEENIFYLILVREEKRTKKKGFFISKNVHTAFNHYLAKEAHIFFGG